MGNQNSIDQASCFSCMGRQNPEMPPIEWKKYLKKECMDLKDKCIWAQGILKQLKYVKKAPLHVYYQQLQSGIAEFRILQARQSKSFSYSCNNLMTTSINQEQMTVKKLLQQTDILEDAFQNSIPQQQNNQYNPYLSGGSYASSYIYLERLEQLKIMSIEIENNDLLKQQLRFYLKVSNILKSQLQKNDHQLNFIMNLFAANFIKKYNEDRSKLDLEDCIFDIQQFSRVLEQTIEYYYSYDIITMQIGKVSELFNRENMLSQTITLLFDIDMVYEILYDMVLDQYREQVELLRLAMMKIADIDCGYLDIDVKFRLDESNYKFLQKSFSTTEQSYKEVIPYEQSIRIISNLNKHYSPSSKLKAIIKCQQKILKSIKQFYNYHNCQCDYQIDSDNLLGIQTYIVAKSQQFELPVHLFICEKLATNKMIHGSTGYYLVSLQAAIKMILQLKN